MYNQSPINDPEPFSATLPSGFAAVERLADPSRAGTQVAGLILILLGGMFLMQNMGSYTIPLKNWWALFILIPAFGAFNASLRTYRNAGNQFTAPARGSLLLGTVLTLVTLGFLFGISWTSFGLVLIILVGIGILINAMLK